MALTTEELKYGAEVGDLGIDAVRAVCAEALANREAQPVGFDVLADAVKEVTGGIRMEFAHDTYKGHQPVPFMNFTSLSRIVEMFRIAPPAPESTNAADWGINMQTGTPILVYKNCSVIESEQAHYVLSLINGAAAPEGGNG
ncbi:hypothetical protein JY469_21720 [Serratia marcescens]|nr:hypothetical protein [Serratia marcescens]